MVQLLDSDIKTREVLDWKGVHLIHYMGSSCSQKVRIFLNLKGIDWESHTNICSVSGWSGVLMVTTSLTLTRDSTFGWKVSPRSCSTSLGSRCLS